MPGIAELLLNPLQGLLNTLQSERHYNDKNFDDALLAIESALLATKKHIELSGTKRDRGKEYDLALLWKEASIKARRANIPFTDALSEKSRYWEDKNIWKEDQVIEKSIQITQIEDQIKKLRSRS